VGAAAVDVDAVVRARLESDGGAGEPDLRADRGVSSHLPVEAPTLKPTAWPLVLAKGVPVTVTVSKG